MSGEMDPKLSQKAGPPATEGLPSTMDLRVPKMLTKSDPWYKSLRESYQEAFGPRKIIRIKTRPGAEPPRFKSPTFQVDFGTFKDSLLWSLRQLFRPEKLPPLPASARKIKMEEDGVWGSKAHTEQAKRTQTFSLLVHATFLLLVAFPFMRQVVEARQNQDIYLDTVDISAYMPDALKKSGGGGGGGDRSQNPASLGRLPKFRLDHQLTPPAAKIKNLDPLLAADPSLIVPPDIKLPSPDMPNFGDPLSNTALLANGPGAGAGIGTGIGGGIGAGFGAGFGQGEGGGYGGNYFQVGGSVSKPICIDCPDPEYAEEARKARYQGTVVLWAIIDANGRVRNLRVVKSIGLGLDEEAMRAVQTWIFRPSLRFGKPVPVGTAIEVDFNIF